MNSVVLVTSHDKNGTFISCIFPYSNQTHVTTIVQVSIHTLKFVMDLAKELSFVL